MKLKKQVEDLKKGVEVVGGDDAKKAGGKDSKKGAKNEEKEDGKGAKKMTKAQQAE